MSLNFDSLAANDVDPGTIKGTTSRKSAVHGTPVIGWFRETIETGRGKSVTLDTAEAAKELVRLVAMAASELDTGRKVRTVERDGKFVVMFTAAPKRQRRSAEEVEAAKEAAKLAHPAGKGRK